MTVRVTKPEFNLREKLSEIDKPVGVHGNDILKSNSLEETCAIVGSGRKNLVINGNFDVWQRGTAFNSFNSIRYTADRWLQYAAGGSTITVTQQQFTVGQTEVPGNPRYYYRSDNTPDADTSWLELFHRIEDVTRFSDVPVTLSFWMKANKPQFGEDEVRLVQNFGTSGSTKVTTQGPIFDILTHWKKYEFTFDLPSVAGKTINANSFLEIHWIRVNTAVSSDTYYDIAQVQLEYGRGATPFEQRSYSEELALCQRYCVSYGGDDEVHLGTGHAYNSTNFNVSLHLPVPMRSKPSASRVNNGAGNWVQIYVGATGNQSDPSITIGDAGGTVRDIHSIRMYLPSSHSGRTAGEAAWVHTLADAKLILSAEI